MSFATPSNLRKKAATKYETACLNLRRAIPKDIQTQVLKVSYPNSELQQSKVSERAKVLERAIEGVLRYRNDLKDKQKKKRIGNIVVRWFRASYPFANLFLCIMKDGSAVFVS